MPAHRQFLLEFCKMGTVYHRYLISISFFYVHGVVTVIILNVRYFSHNYGQSSMRGFPQINRHDFLGFPLERRHFYSK